MMSIMQHYFGMSNHYIFGYKLGDKAFKAIYIFIDNNYSS